MPRSFITFTERQIKTLRADARKQGISVSELARRLVNEKYGLDEHVLMGNPDHLRRAGKLPADDEDGAEGEAA